MDLVRDDANSIYCIRVCLLDSIYLRTEIIAMTFGITAPEGEIFDINVIRAQADYYAVLVKDMENKNPGGVRRFERAVIALRFMAAFIESHGGVTGVNMVKQWAGIA